MVTCCFECRNFHQEFDVNYQGCLKEEQGEEIKDVWWSGDENCPFFECYPGEE